VLAVRAQEARRRGYRYLTIDASPMSRPIVAKHGFQLLTFAHACNWHVARSA
jgi:G:T-mismatch repair DNA endonuclease (very short patch repair protein)